MEEDHRGRVTAEVGLGFGDLRGAKAAADDAERVLPRVVTDVTATRSDAAPTPSSTFSCLLILSNYMCCPLASDRTAGFATAFEFCDDNEDTVVGLAGDGEGAPLLASRGK